MCVYETLTHVVDPKHPGAIDEILNFGEFWNEDGIRENRDEIVKITTKIGKLFKRGYKFFAAAKSIRDDMEVNYEEALDQGKFNDAVRDLKKEILGSFSYNDEEGKVRRLFGSALSPKGLVDYYATIVGTMQTVYYIEGSYVKGSSRFMKEILDEAVKKGLNVEAYYEPLDEKNIETLIIPKINVAITTSDKYAHTNYKKIEFHTFMNQELLTTYETVLNEDKIFMEKLLNAGIANITNAKKMHDDLEKSYIPNMDFKKIDAFLRKIIERILKYADEIKN